MGNGGNRARKFLEVREIKAGLYDSRSKCSFQEGGEVRRRGQGRYSYQKSKGFIRKKRKTTIEGSGLGLRGKDGIRRDEVRQIRAWY